MSNDNPDKDLNLDLHFLPSWAQESPEINRYANYDGPRERRGGRDRDRRGGPNRGGGDRSRGPRNDRGPRPDRASDRSRGDHSQGKGRGPRPDRRGGNRSTDRRPELPMPEVNLVIMPEERGVDLLTKQIRVTGRAYPLFDIARLVLQKEDRYRLEFSVKKAADGSVVQPIYSCVLDDTLWLSEDDAVAHILAKHLGTFYEEKKTPTDPPKGTYTFVAQCGMSGVILGPPNYHDYQVKLRQLHAERFARMPFETFKSRVKIVKDEAVVQQWVEEQSFKTEYEVLNVPESLTLQSMEEVEKHFRETHSASMVKSVETCSISGDKSRRVGARDLQRMVFRTVDEQKRFPLKLVTTLSQKFASRGLQFFKVNKTIVHVAVARPHYLDLESTSVSDGVRKIVEYVNEHNRCSVKELVEVLAPAPAEAASAPAPEPTQPTPEGGSEAAPTEAPAPHPEPTAAQRQVLSDLHWLVHQGHVIEFASGDLETAKKPNPKPTPKPKKAAPKSAPVESKQDVDRDAEAATPGASAAAAESPSSPPSGPVEPVSSTPAPTVEPMPASVSPSPQVEESATSPEPEFQRPVIDGSAVGDLQMLDDDFGAEQASDTASSSEAEPEDLSAEGAPDAEKSKPE